MTDQQHLHRTSELRVDVATTDELLRAWHRDRAATLQPPPALATKVAGIPELVPGRRPLPGLPASRRAQVLVVIGLLLVAAAAAAAVGAGLLRQRTEPAPFDLRTLSWEEQQLAQVSGSLATTLAYSGDEFLALAGDGQPISTSADGGSWQETTEIPGAPSWDHVAAWKETILSWSAAADVVSVQHPGGIPLVQHAGSAPHAIVDAAVGPAGIVVLERSSLSDQDIIGSVLGADWADHIAQTCHPDCPPGVLTVTRDDGQTAEISLADHGYVGQNDPSWAGGWYSKTGAAWTAISGLPLTWDGYTHVGWVAASPDGFYALLGNGIMWHSPNGLDWHQLGPQPAPVDELIPWRDGVLAVGANAYRYWTTASDSTLRTGDLPGAGCCGAAVTDAGPLGIVTVSRDENRVLFSPDGQSWSEMALPQNRAWSSGFSSWADTSVAVGRDAALVVLWEWEPNGTGEVPSLWRLTSE